MCWSGAGFGKWILRGFESRMRADDVKMRIKYDRIHKIEKSGEQHLLKDEMSELFDISVSSVSA